MARKLRIALVSRNIRVRVLKQGMSMTRNCAVLLVSTLLVAPAMVRAGIQAAPFEAMAGAPSRCNVTFTPHQDFRITSHRTLPVRLSAEQVEVLELKLAIADVQDAAGTRSDADSRDDGPALALGIDTATPLHCVGWAYSSS